jgi:hypothetical protein
LPKKKGKNKKDRAHPESPKKATLHLHTHTHTTFFILFYEFVFKKNKENPQRKEKKNPHTQKYTLKSFQDHRASECMHKERRRGGGRVGRSRSFFFITELVSIIPPVVDSVSFLS